MGDSCMKLIQNLYQFNLSFFFHHHVWFLWLYIRQCGVQWKMISNPFKIILLILYFHRNIACNVLRSFCMNDRLKLVNQIFTSQKRIMIITTSNGYCEFWTWWTRSIEILWMPMIFPSSSSPEKWLISDFVNHKLISF